MPLVDTTMVRAYAHCENYACSGYQQEEVDAVRIETQYLFRDNGGDAPGVERSSIALQFADTDEDGQSETRPCPDCGRPRALSLETRRNYDHLSGFPQDGLTKGKKFDGDQVNTKRDQEMAEMQAQMAAQAAQIQQLLDATTASEPDGRAELEQRVADQEAELEQLRAAAAEPAAEPAAEAPVEKKAAAKRTASR